MYTYTYIQSKNHLLRCSYICLGFGSSAQWGGVESKREKPICFLNANVSEGLIVYDYDDDGRLGDCMYVLYYQRSKPLKQLLAYSLSPIPHSKFIFPFFVNFRNDFETSLALCLKRGTWREILLASIFFGFFASWSSLTFNLQQALSPRETNTI